MADNVAITAGSGTNVATDDIGSVHYQRVKVAHGADGSATDSSDATPFPSKQLPVTSGGCSVHRRVSASGTNGQSVKASAGQLYGVIAVNTNTSARYLKLYNKASAPTVGTDTPVMTLTLPGSGGIAWSIPVGVEFATGIASALTTGAADSDTGGVAADEVIFQLLYK